jgi:hypothetical protein
MASSENRISNGMSGGSLGMLSAGGERKELLLGQQLSYGMLQIFQISGISPLQARLN